MTKKQCLFDYQQKLVTLNNGCQMPIYGLGTYGLSGNLAIASILHAFDLGVRLIDTASFYRNEAIVGQAIKQSGLKREEIFLETKLYPNQYSNATQAIDAALNKLQVDEIDLLLLHHPATNDWFAYQEMEKAVQAGKVRSLGLSNWYIKELNEFLPKISLKPVLIQNEIHPYYQASEVVSFIQKQQMVMQAWYPLAGRGYTKILLNDAKLREIANRYQKTVAQIVLRWHLQNKVVAIPGSSNLEHLKENVDIFDFSLTPEEMAEIKQLNRDEKHDWY